MPTIVKAIILSGFLGSMRTKIPIGGLFDIPNDFGNQEVMVTTPTGLVMYAVRYNSCSDEGEITLTNTFLE